MKKLLLFFLSIFFIGCSSMQIDSTKFSKIDKNSTITILPFKNLSQSPYAGVKASNIAEGVLRSKGYKVIRGYTINKNDEIKLKDINNSKYILKGEVNEWRYKTGIDGEPAVDIYVEIEDKNGSVIYSNVGAKSDWGHKSVGICAQELIEDMF